MKIRDVAEQAGVSIATISRVINHPELVAEETRIRVQEIINQSEYRKGAITPVLSNQKSSNAIAICTQAPFQYRNLYEGIQKVYSGKKYTLQLYYAKAGTANHINTIDTIIATRPAGVIIDSELASESVRETLRTNGIPFVCIGGKPGLGNDDLCYISYYDGASKIVEYLESLGVNSVMLIISENDSDRSRQLEAGFRDNWQGKLSVYAIDNTPDSGYTLFTEIADETVTAEAIVTETDEIAFGVLRAARELSVRVPEDVKIIGFDNSPISVTMIPPLTTMEQPTLRLGVLSARRLLDIIEENEFFDVEAKEISLKGRFKIRRSCSNTRVIYDEFE